MPVRSPAATRYLVRTLVASLAYLVAVFLSFHVFYHGKLALPAALGLALVPSLPLVAIIAIVGLYLREEKDEFEREIFIQSLLWATGVTLAVNSFWSFVHLFARFPSPDAFHLFLLFWLTVGLSTLPLRRYYGGQGE